MCCRYAARYSFAERWVRLVPSSLLLFVPDERQAPRWARGFGEILKVSALVCLLQGDLCNVTFQNVCLGLANSTTELLLRLEPTRSVMSKVDKLEAPEKPPMGEKLWSRSREAGVSIEPG